jgi:hypothetical protein
MSIHSVGGVPVLPRHRLSCHCGVVASAQLADIRVAQGQEHF